MESRHHYFYNTEILSKSQQPVLIVFVVCIIMRLLITLLRCDVYFEGFCVKDIL